MNHLNEDSTGTTNELSYKSVDEHLKMNYLNKQSHFSQISSPPTSPSSFNSSMSPPSVSLDDSITKSKVHTDKIENNNHSVTNQNEKCKQISNNEEINGNTKEEVMNYYGNKSLTINDEPRKKYEKNRTLSPNSSNKVSSILAPSHKCKECFRTFKDINNYKEHRFQEHQSTEFPNVRKCSMCSYATLLKSKYDCHMRCHLNNKVIKCHRCPYSTINIRHMSRHERMHMVAGNNSNSGNITTVNSSNTNINSHSKFSNKNSNSFKNKSYKKDAKIKMEKKLKKKRIIFEENHKPLNLNEENEKNNVVEKNNNEIKSTSSNESVFNQNYDKNDSNNENLYNLSMVAAATIAAINNTVNNNTNNSSISNLQSLNMIKNQSLNELDTEKNSATLINLEMLKNILLNQIENRKNKTNGEESDGTISSVNQSLQKQSYSGNFDNPNYKHISSENKIEPNLSNKYPSPNLKFNVSSITPPSSASSISSTSSSPNGRKTTEIFLTNQGNDNNNNNLIHHPSPRISDIAVNNFYPNNLSNTTLSQHNVYSNQNEFTSNSSNHPTNQIESLAFYQSNIEHIIKLQSMSNFNGNASVPPFFNNLLQNDINSIPSYSTNSTNSNSNYHKNNFNFHQQTSHLMSHQPQQSQSHSPYLQDKRKYDIPSGPLKFECDSDNQLIPCRHRLELEKLRINVYKLIFNLMPQLMTAFNIDFGSVHNTTHIDTFIDYLINNQNNYKVNQI